MNEWHYQGDEDGCQEVDEDGVGGDVGGVAP